MKNAPTQTTITLSNGEIDYPPRLVDPEKLKEAAHLLTGQSVRAQRMLTDAVVNLLERVERLEQQIDNQTTF